VQGTAWLSEQQITASGDVYTETTSWRTPRQRSCGIYGSARLGRAVGFGFGLCDATDHMRHPLETCTTLVTCLSASLVAKLQVLFPSDTLDITNSALILASCNHHLLRRHFSNPDFLALGKWDRPREFHQANNTPVTPNHTPLLQSSTTRLKRHPPTRTSPPRCQQPWTPCGTSRLPYRPHLDSLRPRNYCLTSKPPPRPSPHCIGTLPPHKNMHDKLDIKMHWTIYWHFWIEETWV
jgi:hypothetical protein